MKKIIKILLFFLGIFILLIVVIRLNENHYKSKFDNTKINTSFEMVKSDWGVPSDEFMYKEKDKYVLKYKKGIIGWNTYIFLFDEKKTYLIEKYIDD